jgi:hypothetical protein
MFPGYRTKYNNSMASQTYSFLVAPTRPKEVYSSHCQSDANELNESGFMVQIYSIGVPNNFCSTLRSMSL